MFFLITLGIIFFIVISPYLNFGDKGYLYFSMKPYFMQFFGSKESMWVFFAFFIIPLKEIHKLIAIKYKTIINMENAQNGLQNEMKLNMDSVFSKNVDKPVSLFWYEQINNNLASNFNKSEKTLWQDFSDLYKEIIYYQNLMRVYFWSNKQEISEYQFSLQLVFCNFINWKSGLEEVNTDRQSTLEHKKNGRNVLSEVYPIKKEELLKKLKTKIDRLFQ